MIGEGVVVCFDREVGLGSVRDARGGKYRFHCTQIADGTREIPEGVAVRYRRAAGRGGVWEAVEVSRS